MKDGMSKAAANEYLSDCRGIKKYYKKLFGTEVQVFVTVEEQFREVEDWRSYFRQIGLSRILKKIRPERGTVILKSEVAYNDSWSGSKFNNQIQRGNDRGILAVGFGKIIHY